MNLENYKMRGLSSTPLAILQCKLQLYNLVTKAVTQVMGAEFVQASQAAVLFYDVAQSPFVSLPPVYSEGKR